MPKRPSDLFVTLVVLLSLPGLSVAEESEAPETVSYWNDVRPIFQAQCQGCHQPAKANGEYVMTDFAKLLAGGESGETAIAPKDPDASYLMGQIEAVDGKAEMPQGADPLTEAQVGLIRRWIEAGAIDDTPASAKRRYDAEHPPEYVAAPVLTALDYSPDGKLLAVSGYHEVLLHETDQLATSGSNAAPAQRLIGMSERIESVAFSPDGTHLAVAGGSPGRLGELQVWNVETGELKFSVSVSYDTCYGASWSHDGKLVAVGCPDNTVRCFDVASGEQVLFSGAHNDWVLDTVFSNDGKHLVTVSRDRSMKLIEVETERFIDNITSITPGALKGGLHAVDRHPSENQLLIGGSDGVPKVYRMFREKARKIGDDFNLIKAYPGMPGRIFDVAYQRDGSHLVAGSSLNGQGHVHVFHTESGKRIAALESIESAVYCVAMTPDGKTVASGGFDGQLYLHEAATGKLLAKQIPVPMDDNANATAAR